MRKKTKEFLSQLSLAVFVFAFAAVLALPMYWHGKYRRDCMRHGYPDVVYMVGHEPHCINALESTPLKELESK